MNYEQHLKQLRKLYYESFPRQRVHIAKQRIRNPAHGPNLIVTYVSAIEGVLRSLVVWKETTSDRPKPETYERYKNYGVNKRYKRYLAQCNIETEKIIAPEKYRLVGYAVEYRNLLAHECTYLGQATYSDLIEACNEFLSSLCGHAGIDYS
jgi:hypothetical protein